MTSLSDTRDVLLAQHANIRLIIEMVREVCDSLPIDRGRLTLVLERLIEAVQTHNQSEEEALKNVLPGLDAFGAVRKGVMIAEHAAEHTELRETLIACRGKDSTETLAAILTLMDRLASHMQHEEDLFLNAKILDHQ